MLPAILTALALLASTTTARFLVPQPKPAVKPRDDTYFQINYYSDSSCQNYVADFAGYMSSPFVYSGDGGGIYAGSFIVVNMGTWTQTLDVNGQTVFDISGCPSGSSAPNQIGACFPLGVSVGAESVQYGSCNMPMSSTVILPRTWATLPTGLAG
ncbi:uncharacterized protein LOC62_07G008947 [Vanrija pseudolonga]|uniref:Uncharacterized protein n=1 Tax=Vanrija pseudolonga TaxID=143232 RepID=A0AAF0YKP7_9TREE|nr:hypothetical protein LOC62_07G008947 [Vanrija pseudolonga]